MKAFNYLVFYLCLCLIGGILLSSRLTVSINQAWFISILFLSLAFVSHYILPHGRKNWQAIPFYLSFIAIGILVSAIHAPEAQNNHYINHLNKEVTSVLHITQRLRPTAYSDRYEGIVEYINKEEASGKILISVQASDSSNYNEPKIKIDDRLIIHGSLEKVQEPRNPYGFNYGNYLQNQGIYAQLVVNQNELYILKNSNPSLKGYAEQVRQFFQSKLGASKFLEEEWAVINALLLGQRQDLSTDLRDRYADAGVIHILAVSGLHVGIVLFILQFLLKPLGNSLRMRYLKALLCILGVWSFAWLTGFSPSVLRAATMFSFLQIGLSSSRKSGGMNGLIASAFFLLLFNPQLIYQVGFQLSYSAVFFILWLQPVLSGVWEPKSVVVRYFWGILCVSFTAQLGVLPLSLFYFHQLPLLFLVTNLVVIPLLFLILSFGFFILFLAACNLLVPKITEAYALLVKFMNGLISWSSNFQNLVFKDIYFNLTLIIVVYVLIFSAGRYFQQPNYKRLYTFLLATLLLVFCLNYEQWTQRDEELFIVHKYRSTAIMQQKGSFLKVYQENPQDTLAGFISDFKSNNIIDTINYDSVENILIVNSNHLLIVDSTAIYEVPNLQADYILLTQSPDINLNRLIKRYPQASIIADGSNYRSDIIRWRNTCKNWKIPFHNTYEKGYFKIE